MSDILKFEGFEGDLTRVALTRKYPASVNLEETPSVVLGRFGGKCLQHLNDGITPIPIIEIQHTSLSTPIYLMGMAVKFTGVNATGTLDMVSVWNDANQRVFDLDFVSTDGSTLGITLSRYLTSGPVTEYVSTDIKLENDIWYFVEFRASLRPGIGGAELQINDQIVFTSMPGYALAEALAGASKVQLKIPAYGGNGTTCVDDIYIAFGAERKFLGSKSQTVSIWPNSDIDRGWLPLDTENNSITRYKEVDDASVGDTDDDLSYVYGTQPQKKATFRLSPVLGIRDQVIRARMSFDAKSDIQNFTIVPQILEKSLDEVALDTSYKRYEINDYINPVTGKGYMIEDFEDMGIGFLYPGTESAEEGSTLNFTAVDGSNVRYISLDENSDLPVTVISGSGSEVIEDVAGTHIPVSLSGGGTGEIDLQADTLSGEIRPYNYLESDPGDTTPAVYSAHFRNDGGFLSRPSEGATYTVTNPQPINIRLTGTNTYGAIVNLSVNPESTALAGTHYSTSDLVGKIIPPGSNNTDIDISLSNTVSWFKEKLLSLNLTNIEGAQTFGWRDFHFWIYPQVDPPTGEFDTSSIVTPSAATYLAGVELTGTTEEQSVIYLRAKGTSGNWIKGVHYDFPDSPVTIPSGTNPSSDFQIQIFQQAIDDFGPSGTVQANDSLVIYLDHEPSDGSQENFWQFTESWVHEGTVGNEGVIYGGTRTRMEYPYTGEPTTHASGGGGNLDDYEGENETTGYLYLKVTEDMGISPTVYKPNGEEAVALIAPTYLKSDVSDWYTRESFFAEEWSGTRGRKQTFGNFMLLSTYVKPFTETETYTNSSFFNLNVRNRAPGDLEQGAAFHRSTRQSDVTKGSNNQEVEYYHNGTLTSSPVQIDGHWWYPWIRERLAPEAKIGIEEEIDPETGESWVRLWVLIDLTVGNWVMTNTGFNQTQGGLSGTATGGSSTALIDSSVNFVSLRVGVGDVVYSNTDGCIGYVTNVSATTLTLNDLTEGLKNSFDSGDSYYIARNYRTTVSNVETYGDPGWGIKVTVNKMSNLNLNTTGEYVGKFDEVINETKSGASHTIDFDTGDTGIGEDFFLVKGGLLSDFDINDLITIRNQSQQPGTTWDGNAIYRYMYCNKGDGLNGQLDSYDYVGEDNLYNSGIIAMWPSYIVKSTEAELLRTNKPDPFYGPDTHSLPEVGRFWEKRGFWWEPRGNFTRKSGGQTTLTVNLS